ncbi:hypothetical protein [Pseudooceanicola aestuarii]|uniref:hypothetical protein n=1 Tax=Pseudooceanicola aestuarii TaxID=2697319 RepID=UPI0013D08936|nr:hypothetical protein [Pseudooceanicola aestuarii]
MSEALDELQRRLTAAMDEIAAGVDRLDRPQAEPVVEEAPGTPVADPEEIARLTAALDDERVVNAQLQERVRAIKSRQNDRIVALEQAEADHRLMMEKLDTAVVRLRRVNNELRETVRALREANAEGLVEPELIDRAMLAELEGLRADHAASQSEALAIKTELQTLLADDAQAAAIGEDG